MAHKAHEHKQAHDELGRLPDALTSPADLGRLIRELETLNEEITQNALRGGAGSRQKPDTSKLMEQTLELNNADIMNAEDRAKLKDFLNNAKTSAPVMHMSFSSDPSPAFMSKVIVWFRTEVHPLALVQIGLQPNIGAGFILRTTNKYFDLSLRQDLTSKRDTLLEAIRKKTSAGSSEAQPSVAGATAAVTEAEAEMLKKAGIAVAANGTGIPASEVHKP